MRYTHFILLMFCLALTWSCKNDPKTTVQSPENPILDRTKPTKDTLEMPDLSTNGASTYHIMEGNLFWSGNKDENNVYSAQIRVSGGELLVNNNFILRGNILFDIAGLTITDDVPAGEKQKIENALRGAGYFNAAKYPVMEYNIEGALPSSIPAFNTVLEGSLKIKDKTNVLNVPATLNCKDDMCQLESLTFDLGYNGWGLTMPGQKAKPASGKAAAGAPPVSDVIRLVLKCTARKKN